MPIKALILAAILFTGAPWVRADKPYEPEVTDAAAVVDFATAQPDGNSEQLTDSEPQRIERYAGIEISDDEMRELAALVYLEARGEPFEGQQAVVEVVLNRVLSDEFPDTVHGVIYDTKYGVQFTPYRQVASTTPTETQYEAVNCALYGEPVLDVGVLYFSRGAYNSRIYATIGGHVFCYG